MPHLHLAAAVGEVTFYAYLTEVGAEVLSEETGGAEDADCQVVLGDAVAASELRGGGEGT